MPAYQIHRLKETQRQQFRWAPHTPGVTIVKLKDYEPGSVVEAATPYALWLALRESDNAIGVGDLIEVVGQTTPAANFVFLNTSDLKKRAGTYRNRPRIPWESQWR